ncbi:hypothetical protein BSQ39_09510 [Loigolactobacillus backii]|uniref:hypothetical protein n=1 Tax=Loigolactobacillus backii TaxID=375175 RepID=UPI000C1CB4C3|nr:hypothetical protein [Loigolactobacillus backii]PIO83786.1 hypothetical protein BSQ39_09510 [Loigolactobacillus backii]
MNLFSKEEIALDHELVNLIEDIKFNVHAIEEDSTVTVDGKYIPSSEVAVTTAKELLRASEILKLYENENDAND